MNKVIAKEIMDALKIALTDIEEKYNITFNINKASFAEECIDFSLHGIEAINKELAEEKEFEKYCRKYGFSKDMYGYTFTDKEGTTVKFIGFIPQNRKYSCMLQNIKNKEKYSCSPEFIRKYIERQEDNSSKKEEKCAYCKHCNIDIGRDGSICYECHYGNEYMGKLSVGSLEWKKLLENTDYKPYCKYEKGRPTKSYSGND